MKQISKSAKAGIKKQESNDSATSSTNIVNAPVVVSSTQSAVITPLTPAEIKLLAECEAIIGNGLKAIKDAYGALQPVCEQRLYRTEYSTFEEYCIKKWGFTPRHANRLMSAAAVVANVESDQLVSFVPAAIPQNEAQARPLTALTPPQQVKAARIVAAKTDAPTAKDFEEAAEKVADSKPRVAVAAKTATKPSTGQPSMETLIEMIDEIQTMIKVSKPKESVLAKLKLAADLATKINNGGRVC